MLLGTGRREIQLPPALPGYAFGRFWAEKADFGMTT
jgi:hypothetical protein